MRNIDEKVLEIAFKSETGSYKESVPFRDYIEWLEEKATQLFLLQSHSNLRNELGKQNDNSSKETRQVHHKRKGICG